MMHRNFLALATTAGLLALAAAPAGADYQRIKDPTGTVLGANGGVVYGPGTDGRPYEFGLCNQGGPAPFTYGYLYGDPNRHWNPNYSDPTKSAPPSGSDFSGMFSPYGGGTDTTCSGDGPTVTTGNASAIQAHSATISGTVKPNGVATNYWWQYGLDTTYGSQTGTDYAGDGHGVKSVSRPIGGLLPGQTYHYRLVANSAAGRTLGPDKTLTTTS
jgi:hypothetical protein